MCLKFEFSLDRLINSSLQVLKLKNNFVQRALPLGFANGQIFGYIFN